MGVPTSSRALSRRGWCSWRDLGPTDEVLGLDTKRQTLRWTTVRGVQTSSDSPLIKLANRWLSLESTPEHVWWGAKYTDRGSRGRAYVPRFFSTAEFGPRHMAVLSAPAETDRRLNLTATQIAVITWLVTDGHIVRTDPHRVGPSQAKGRKIHFGGSVFQKKPHYVAAIDELLIEVPHSRYVRPSGIVQWKIVPQYLRDLWRVARLDELTWEQFVLQLDGAQRKVFTETAWQAEGYVSDVTRRMSQNAGDLLDGMRLAWFLDGYFVTQSKEISRTGKLHITIRASRPRVTGQRLQRTCRGLADVWNLRTDLGTWVVRQDDRILVTGSAPSETGDQRRRRIVQ